MQGLGLIASIIVGGLAGWGASSLMRTNTGILANIVMGIVGAIIANFLASFIGINFASGWIGQGIAGLIGACLLIFVVRAVRN